jgi:hypothetical protein
MRPLQAEIVTRTARARISTSVLALLAAAGACGSDAAPQDAARAPARSGDVWVLGASNDRTQVTGALLAFVSGTHVLVVDGNDTYAGMRVTHGGKAPDGGQPLALAGGIEATLVPAGDSMELRFASGERLPLHKRPEAAERGR